MNTNCIISLIVPSQVYKYKTTEELVECKNLTLSVPAKDAQALASSVNADTRHSTVRARIDEHMHAGADGPFAIASTM